MLKLRSQWGGHFCLRIMSVDDAKKAVTLEHRIMISNHGGRQLMVQEPPLSIKEIVDAVGDKIEIICDGE